MPCLNGDSQPCLKLLFLSGRSGMFPINGINSYRESLWYPLDCLYLWGIPSHVWWHQMPIDDPLKMIRCGHPSQNGNPHGLMTLPKKNDLFWPWPTWQWETPWGLKCWKNPTKCTCPWARSKANRPLDSFLYAKKNFITSKTQIASKFFLYGAMEGLHCFHWRNPHEMFRRLSSKWVAWSPRQRNNEN